ncbi:MAG: hypothetical protein ACI4U5_03865 [Bacilli bacterium]
MKTKLLCVFCTSLFTIFTSVKTNETSFKYMYSIRAASYSPLDEGTLYTYKEKLIDIYENLCLDVDERYHEQLIKNNIKLFSFNSAATSYYANGMINVVIGKGKGSKIQGRLRKNSCDNEVIREKIYIFDILNGV